MARKPIERTVATHIILNCKGSAFAKLQLRKKDLLAGAVESGSQIVEIVGGKFGG